MRVKDRGVIFDCATAAPDVRVVGWAAGPSDRSLDDVRAHAEAAARAIVEETR